MLQLTKYFPLKPIYLALLVFQIYLLVFSWTMLGCAFLLFSFIFLIYQYDRETIFKTIAIVIFFLFYFLWQNHNMNVQYQRVPNHISQIKVRIDTISINGDVLSFQADASGNTYQAFYTLKNKSEKDYFQNLDNNIMIIADIKLEEAEERRHFNGFDYRQYLKRHGIYRIAKVTKIKQIRLFQHRSFFALMSKWRRSAIVISQTFPNPMRHYMSGLLFGYLDKTFDDMSDLYSSLGIIHLFALSGMQVGFFLGIFRYICLRIGLRLDHVWLLQIPFSLIYAGLTGFSISVVRALIQSLLSHSGVKKDENFALCLLICLISLPHSLLTTGGVLSFAYAFILTMTSFDHFSSIKKVAIESLTVSVGILPILTYYFSGFQPISIILTALLSFAFDIIFFPLLTVIFVLSPIVKLSCINSLFEILEVLLKWTGQLFPRPLIFGKPSLFLLIVMIIILGLLYDYYHSKCFRYCSLLIIFTLFFITKNPITNEVAILDVGQGDSILVRDWLGKTILIDTGGRVRFEQPEEWKQKVNQSNAKRTLIPYLKSRGISKIDDLVITHTDTDHMGDMEVISKHFKVARLITSSGSLTNSQYVKHLSKIGVAVKSIEAGDKLAVMGSYLQVLYPWHKGDGKNNDSIVLYGHLLGKGFLFTGDLEEEGEKQLLEAYPNLSVDILKAGHHGSKGSSSLSFLKKLSPSVVLVSAGKNNRYQHPHQETLQRFQKIKSKIFRTDQSGTIRLTGWWKWHIQTVR
ncbi:TPA: DNA internalization-related competence protein ComEC/Rec2 [Streptococcus agalactiae]